jgi:hypothetical protein
MNFQSIPTVQTSPINFLMSNIQFAQRVYSVIEGQTVPITLTRSAADAMMPEVVRLSAYIQKPENLSTGDALETDFVPIATTKRKYIEVGFSAGETQVTYNFQAVSDAIVEDLEIVELRISGDSASESSGKRKALVIIADN